MSKILIPNGVEATLAEYSPQVIPEYAGNPYLEALPPIQSSQQAAQQLAAYPPFHPEERQAESHYRLHFVRRLFQVFQPLPSHLELENRITTAIRQGYLARNPLTPSYAKALQQGYQVIQNGNWEQGYGGSYRSATLGFSLIGCSGIGKSTALYQILKNIPQVILHREYQGLKFCGYQITYLKLDCPMDGSVKGLCIDFFIKVDNLIGTHYYKKFGTSRHSVDSMIATMGQVCQHLGCGLLIIDEIQNLSLAKSGGAEKMLNFFVSLNNNLGIPVVMVGTPQVLGVLQGEFRLARRADGSQGSLFWDRLNKDQNWELFIHGIWLYQWTRKETVLNQELSEAFYTESQGILDVAVKLYAMAQIQAITTAKEEITPGTIKKVAAENLKMTKPMLESLKTGNLRQLAQYEDLVADIDFGSFLADHQKRVGTDLRLKALQKQQIDQEKKNALSIKEQALLKLIDLGFQAKQVQKTLECIAKEDRENLSVQELVVRAIEILSQKTKRTRDKKNRELSNHDDVRLIVQEGRAKKVSAYEALNAKGWIRSYEEFFKVG